MVATTRSRVTRHTDAQINQTIQNDIAARVSFYARNPRRIDERLTELNREWDIERAIEANAAALAFTGTALGLIRHRSWLLLPLAVTGFLFQHAIQGWCPPVPLLRQLGFRTAQEIEQERSALVALADGSAKSPEEAVRLARKAA